MARELSLTWADTYGYPFKDGTNLAAVMQHAFVVEQDAVTVKQRVTNQLSSFNPPDFTDPAEPHSLLARYPIQVYLTTNYDDYLTKALQIEGKNPVTAVCPWYRDPAANPEPTLPRDYQPSVESPLVYHLHGSIHDPASLVITEQDYVEFLVNLVMDRGMNDQRVVPMQILPALTRRPLLFVGYSLRDWSFQMLFHGLVRAVADVQRRRHVSIQLSPSARDARPNYQADAEAYLTKSFEKLNISVFWGTANDFCSQLSERLGKVP